MTIYLSNRDVHPTGLEPAEFLDLPSMAEQAVSAPGGAGADGTESDQATTTRHYDGQGITVHWDRDRCIHSERCTGGAPTVFDRDARPWVRLDGADPAEVARVIDRCPSGALSYTRTDGAPNGRRGRSADEDPAAATAPDPDGTGPVTHPRQDTVAVVTIRPQRNGPLVIEGPVDLTMPNGIVHTTGWLTLCRCGASRNKPYCDGSHAQVGFTAAGVDHP